MFEYFVYDGVSSDEYGIICVEFSPSTLTTRDSQSSNLNTEKSIRGDIYHIISQEYSEPLTYTMQIINKDYSPIDRVQERAIKKWLCQRGKYKELCILRKQYADIWFFANFNNPKSLYVTDTIGLEFTITTNAPFAFSELREKSWDMTANDIIEDFYVDNDEELPIYPNLTITMKEAGNLILKNESIIGINDNEKLDNTLTINNLSEGEIITMECGYPYISSSIATHNVFDDFNKYWPYLIDGYNRISVDKACTLDFNYREYRKVSIV